MRLIFLHRTRANNSHMHSGTIFDVELDVTLRSVWGTGADFLAGFAEGPPPRFFHTVPTDLDLPPHRVGALVSVVLVFEDRDAEFHVHARVIERRDGTVKRGLTLEVIPEEQERVDVVLVAARGESLPYRRRRYERIAHRMACSLTAPDGKVWRADTTNLNEGGLHVAVSGDLPATGAVLTAEYEVDGRRQSLRARVVEAVGAGPQQGVGLEFQFVSAAERDAWWDEVAKLRGRARRPTG
jgi:hypothetical protein